MIRSGDAAADENWTSVLSLNVERNKWFLERLQSDVAPRMDLRRQTRILDLGCGCGKSSLLLAELFPNAHIVGLDISAANIAQGRRALQARQLPGITFECEDYSQRRFPKEYFDLIVADSVLHFIPGAERDILPKLIGELAPGGHLVFSIPDEGVVNRLHWLLRTILRRIRCPFTDRLILAFARAVHGKSHSDAFLQERINYMYILPSIWFSRRLRSVLCQGLGLVQVHERRYPLSSPGQLRHRLCIFAKPPASELAARPFAG